VLDLLGKIMVQTVSEITALWEGIKNKIQERLNNPEIFQSFFEDTYIDSIKDGTMYVVANSGLASTILSTKYKDLIDDCIKEATQSNFLVSFILKEDIAKKEAKEPQKPSFFADSHLNKDYTFRNFVVGDSNREAYQAALLTVQTPGSLYNPLFIYGGSGLGKTHLLSAVGNAYKEKNPSANVLYVTSEDFFDEYIKFVNGEKQGDELRDFFKKNVDMLLVDDIQLLKGRQKTEQTFFSVFNSLVSNGKQIILTSDTHPSKMDGFDARLLTRFDQGLTLSINPPDQTTAENILKLKIEALQLPLERFDPEVISFFASRFSNNVRELEGRLTRLIFFTSIHPCDHITLEIAKTAVQSDLEAIDDKAKLSEEKIVNAVASYYCLSPAQLTGRIRTNQIAMARHIAMYLVRTMLDLPFTKIGDYFGGKDHATVMNGVQKVEKNLKLDKDLRNAVNELHSKLKS